MPVSGRVDIRTLVQGSTEESQEYTVLQPQSRAPLQVNCFRIHKVGEGCNDTGHVQLCGRNPPHPAGAAVTALGRTKCRSDRVDLLIYSYVCWRVSYRSEYAAPDQSTVAFLYRRRAEATI